MDRSVDSIGSCSLDVDADSTDFSDTSGSLNLATPSSAKDITREFTSRIKERCQISQINCQQTTTILDPTSGKITTIITPTPDTPDTSPVKKPSYLNLACCVNGYSNLTTYDSKLRQNINKSREVSPIRPSTNSLQYCKGFGNFLAPLTPPPPLPIVPMPVSNKTTSSIAAAAATSPPSPPPTSSSHYNNYKETTMTDNKTYNLQEKTVITTTKTNQTQQSYERNNVDVTDNVNGTTHFRSTTKYYNTALISPPSAQLSTGTTITTTSTTNTEQKSFIQQRVERLYGPGALAQGFYSPKKTRSNYNDNNAAILCERLKNAQNQYSNITATTNNYLNNKNQNLNKEYNVAAIDNHNLNNLHNYNKPTTTTTKNTHINIINNKQNNTTTTDITEDYENIKNCDDLPVLRHLRPEFRAQLPILSPKRTPSLQYQNQIITENKLINNLIDDNNILTTNTNTVLLTNGTSNGVQSLKTITKNIPTKNITIKNDISITNNSQQQYLNGNDKLLIHQQKQHQQQDQKEQQQYNNKDLQKQQQQLYEKQKQQNNNDNYRTTNLDTTTKNFDVINSFSSSSLPVSKIVSSSASLLSSSSSISSDPSSVIIVKNSNNSSDTVINSLLEKTTITNDNNDTKISLKSKEDNNLKIIKKSDIQSLIDFKEDNLIKSDNMASATELMSSTAGTVTTAETSKIALKSIINDKDSIENLTKVINNNNIRDGHYFLQLLKTEQNRLLDLAAKAEKENEILSSNTEISDEIFGYLRSASGKARLLVSQKMKQFEGLCNYNLNQSPNEKFPTTVEDLQGFWDMVMLQVDNVDSLFKEIEILRHNGWKKPLQDGPSPPTGSKLVRRPISKTASNVNSTSSSSAAATTTKTITNGACSKKSAAATLAAQKREAQRKQLMELKRKNKQQQQQQDQQKNSNSVEIFVSDNNHHFSS